MNKKIYKSTHISEYIHTYKTDLPFYCLFYFVAVDIQETMKSKKIKCNSYISLVIKLSRQVSLPSIPPGTLYSAVPLCPHNTSTIQANHHCSTESTQAPFQQDTGHPELSSGSSVFPYCPEPKSLRVPKLYMP